MKELFNKVKNLSIITIVASVVIGAVLLIKPDEALQFVSIACGATMITLGIASWIYYFAKDKSLFLAGLGTIVLVVGIFVCIKYESIVSFLLFFFGLFILVSGIINLLTSFRSRKYGLGSWAVSLVLSVLTVILGIVILVNPFNSMLSIIRLLGVGLLIYAVVDIITFVQVKKVASIIKNEINEAVDNFSDAVDDFNKAIENDYSPSSQNEIDVDGEEVD